MKKKVCFIDDLGFFPKKKKIMRIVLHNFPFLILYMLETKANYTQLLTQKKKRKSF